MATNNKPVIDNKRLVEIRRYKRRDSSSLVELMTQLKSLYGEEFIHQAIENMNYEKS